MFLNLEFYLEIILLYQVKCISRLYFIYMYLINDKSKNWKDLTVGVRLFCQRY